MRPLQSRAAAAGFTLTELMIAVAIAGILAVIAVPSYQNHVRQGRRSAAESLMLAIAAREQQYLLDARRYAAGAGALGALNLALPADVAGFYDVTVEPAAPTLPPSYTIIATPVAGSAQAADGALTLDHQGSRTRAGQAGW